MSTRVLLVDDHRVVRDGLRSLIDQDPEMTVIGEQQDGAAAIEATRESHPNVIVMDVTMPGLNGIDATRVITSESPDTHVLCLSMHADPTVVADVLEAGASGYLVKECAGTELIEAIRAVSEPRMYLCERVTDGVVKGYVAHLTAVRAADESHLSTREREVLQLIAEGLSTREIATHLHISPKTVGTHRDHIKAKVGITSVAGLTKYAIRHGLTAEQFGQHH